MFDMKKHIKWSKIKVGLVITIALLTLLVAVFFAGNIQDFFLAKTHLKVQFQEIEGLRRGAPVWILGIEEGSVKNIHLDPVHGVIVTISVNKKVLGYLKRDSRATILTMGLLGDKYVELSTGSPTGQPIQPGETIKGTTEKRVRDLMENSAVTIGKMGEFIVKLDDLVTSFGKGERTIGKLISDPAVYNDLKNATGGLSLLIADMRSFIADVKNSQGTMKKLIDDPTLYNKVVATASGLEEMSKTINKSSGTLKRLIEDPSLYDKMVTTVSDLEAFSKKLKEGHGTLGKLIESPELYESLNKDLKQLSSILERIERGEGLAGALIKNSELSRELEETIVELKNLLKDIKEHPKKYFKFSVF